MENMVRKGGICHENFSDRKYGLCRANRGKTT